MNLIKSYELVERIFFCAISVQSCVQLELHANSIINHLKFHTIAIFVTSEIHSEKNLLLPKFVERTPSIIINVDSKIITNDNRSLAMPIFQNPRESTAYVIYSEYNDQLMKKILKYLDKFVEISPTPTRPKFLLILTVKIDILSLSNVKKVLDYAWSLKFLDFTVLAFDMYNKTVLFNLNPFTQVYNQEYYSRSCEIFPDKLIDVKNYPLIIPVYDNKPYINIIKKGKDYDVEGFNIEYIKIISQKMNFKNRYLFHQATGSLIVNFRFQLENNEINLIPITFFVDSFSYKRNLLFGRFIESKNMAVVVPILKRSEVYFSFEIFLSFLSFPVIVLIFRVYAKIFNFDPIRWNTLYIYRILIGTPASFPQNRIERNIFILIAVSSIIYAIFFFSELEEMKVFHVEKKFDTIEKLLKSEMKIYSPYDADENDLEEIQRLFLARLKINKSEVCFEKLIQTRSVICIATARKARYFINTNLGEDLKPIVKISILLYENQLGPFPYEKASPYAEKFDKIIEQILESGITKIRKTKKEIKTHSSGGNLKKVEENILAQELLFIVSTGFFAALVSFLVEMSKMILIQNILDLY